MILDGSCRAFGNKDGELFCDKAMENDENIPKGFYESECGGCSYDEKTRMLTCKRCHKSRDEFVEASLEVTEGCVIVLDKGVLKCRDDAKPFMGMMKDDNAVEEQPKENQKEEEAKKEL